MPLSKSTDAIAQIGVPATFWLLRRGVFDLEASTVSCEYEGFASQAAAVAGLNPISTAVRTIWLTAQNDPTFLTDAGSVLVTIENAVVAQLAQPDNADPLAGATLVATPLFVPATVGNVTEGSNPATGTLPLSWSAPTLSFRSGAASSYAAATGACAAGPWGAPVSAASSAVTLTGLTSGAHIYVQITASNASGAGPAVVAGPFTVP